MVLSETIIVTSIVTQELIAVLAIPHCLVSLLSVVIAVVTASTVLCSSDRKMGLAKATYDRGVARTTWPLTAAVATNQLLGQGNPEFLHGLVRKVSVMPAENVAVGYH